MATEAIKAAFEMTGGALSIPLMARIGAVGWDLKGCAPLLALQLGVLSAFEVTTKPPCPEAPWGE